LATKNLARTVIEPGRSRKDIPYTKRYQRQERTKCRIELSRCVIDAEYSDACNYPLRKKRWISQPDKLGPAYSWMGSRVGQRWDDVYSELRKKFDTRTIPGNHIINDHLLSEVNYRNETSDRWRRFKWWVDDRGVLQGDRHKKRFQGSKYLPYGIENKLNADAAMILKDRKVGCRGEYLYWFVPTQMAWLTCTSSDRSSHPWWHSKYRVACWREHRTIPINIGTKDMPRWTKTICCKRPLQGFYRQAKKLTEFEVQQWNKISDYVKKDFLYLQEDIDKYVDKVKAYY